MAFTICGIELFSNKTNYIANQSFLRPLDLDHFVSHKHKLVKYNLGILISFHCIYKVRLQLHGAIYRPDSFVLMLRYCANLKAIRYESTRLNRIVADKSHHVIVA